MVKMVVVMVVSVVSVVILVVVDGDVDDVPGKCGISTPCLESQP